MWGIYENAMYKGRISKWEDLKGNVFLPLWGEGWAGRAGGGGGPFSRQKP